MYWINSNQILHNDKYHQMLFLCGPNMQIRNTKWQMAAILTKIKKSPYLSYGFTDQHNDAQ